MTPKSLWYRENGSGIRQCTTNGYNPECRRRSCKTAEKKPVRSNGPITQLCQKGVRALHVGVVGAVWGFNGIQTLNSNVKEPPSRLKLTIVGPCFSLPPSPNFRSDATKAVDRRYQSLVTSICRPGNLPILPTWLIMKQSLQLRQGSLNRKM